MAAVLGADRFIQEIKTNANLQHPHIQSAVRDDTKSVGDGAAELIVVENFFEELREKVRND